MNNNNFLDDLRFTGNETNWVSTVGKNIDEMEKSVAEYRSVFRDSF